MASELIDRASESARRFTVDNAAEFERGFTQADDPFRIPRLLDTYAQRERQSAVREFIEKQGHHFPTTMELIHVQRFAFREMFGSEL